MAAAADLSTSSGQRHTRHSGDRRRHRAVGLRQVTIGEQVRGTASVSRSYGTVTVGITGTAATTSTCGRPRPGPQRAGPHPEPRRTPSARRSARERPTATSRFDEREGGYRDDSQPGRRPRSACMAWRSRTRRLEVLKGVDFEVEQGTIFALLGSNGAGKTVVRILSTLLKADAGTPTVNGFDVATQAANRGPSASRVSSRPSTRSSAAGEPGPGRQAAAPREPRHDRRRSPGALRPDRRGDAEVRDLLRWYAPPARHRHEPHREPAGDLPRRADDRARPPGPPRGVAGRQGLAGRARRCC